MRLTGIPVSPGIAVGRSRLVSVEEDPVSRIAIPEDAVDVEIARLKTAIDATINEIRLQKELVKSSLDEKVLGIFDAYVCILEDPSFLNSAARRILKERVNAEFALHGAVQNLVRNLLNTKDPYFQERTADFEAIRRRVRLHLAGVLPEEFSPGGEELIILAETLSPSETSAFGSAPVVAFATEQGTRTSHTAIIARSLEIPAVVGVNGLVNNAAASRMVIVDGLEGVVIIDPDKEEMEDYRERADAYRRRREGMLSSALPEARTVDGHRILVSSNIDLPEELDSAIAAGANGCGLYRSEFLYIGMAPNFPTEEDHQTAYSRIARTFYPLRVVIRTFDLGGEKYFHTVLKQRERNPALGIRAIRYSLQHRDLFKIQLRGILRASEQKNIALMFPLITNVAEVLSAKALLEECKSELRAEGRPFDEKIPVGIMVEVPSCALTADAFAPHVDFFSIGTNDLIQYLLAIDRNNGAVAHLYNPFHPAVLKCIASVCEAASSAGKPVAVCGEAASDPAMLPILIGMGVVQLSMPATAIPAQKECIRHLSRRACRKLVKKASKAMTGPEVVAIVHDFLEEPES